MSLPRRSFLAFSVATATGLWANARVLGANNRVGVAVIGVNGMGHAHVKTLTARSDIDFVTFCDVDPAALARAAKTVHDGGKPIPTLVADFRKVSTTRPFRPS